VAATVVLLPMPREANNAPPNPLPGYEGSLCGSGKSGGREKTEEKARKGRVKTPPKRRVKHFQK